LIAATARGADLAPVTFLEKVPPEPGGRAEQPTDLPLCRAVRESDSRVKDLQPLLENEGSRFLRSLLPRAWRLFPEKGGAHPLVIVLENGGNHAAVGYRLKTDAGVEEHPKEPYVLLDAKTDATSMLVLHEGGHVLHHICRRGAKLDARWSAMVHSTLAVTDPVTAITEGYAIHLETLWGHFGKEPARRAFYQHQDPGLGAKPGLAAEPFSILKDLLTFSQAWARYHDVRDGLPAFTGPIRPGQYLAYQLDPSRDRSRLKTPQAMVASEGVVAAVLFWLTTSAVVEKGLTVGSGLEQPALIDAEERLLKALGKPTVDGDFRPDLLDVVAAFEDRHRAVSSFLAVSRGITARPELSRLWTQLYSASLILDGRTVSENLGKFQQYLDEIRQAAEKDPATLRAALGPVIPVRAPAIALKLPAFEADFPLEFDLNAVSEGELAALPSASAGSRERIQNERLKSHFASVADFERRVGTTLKALGLETVRPGSH
jgi:hypothetical protein